MLGHPGTLDIYTTGMTPEEIDRQERLAIIKYESETYF